MRLGLAVATKEELPQARRRKRLHGFFKMASNMGYDGIELHISNPRMADTSFLKELSMAYGLEIPAIGTGPTYAAHGISFLSDQRIRRRAVDRLREYIEVAGDLEATIIVGLIRGRTSDRGLTRSKAWQTIRSCLELGARVAKDHGVMLAIEPINRYETDIINTVGDALRMASEINSRNVKIMADTFHMNIEEVSITRALHQSGKRLVHFHVADSNRLAPGKGHINFKSIISELSRIDYDRYVSAEILSEPNARQAFRDTVEYMEPLLRSAA